MDGGTARPDVMRRNTRAAPLAHQEPVSRSCCLWAWTSYRSLLVMTVPWDYLSPVVGDCV